MTHYKMMPLICQLLLADAQRAAARLLAARCPLPPLIGFTPPRRCATFRHCRHYGCRCLHFAAAAADAAISDDGWPFRFLIAAKIYAFRYAAIFHGYYISCSPPLH
jgi:hypothetical protein